MFKKFLFLIFLALSITAAHGQTVAYVTNQGSGSVSVIDASTNTVTATIGVGSQPTGVVFSPDSTRAYVVTNGAIAVIDTGSSTVVATIAVSGGALGYPGITPDGRSLYVPSFFDNSVLVVSTDSNTVTATITLGSNPDAVAITPDGAHAYVLGNLAVSVIDTASNTVVQSIPVNFVVPFFLVPAIAVAPGGGNVYVGGGRFPNVQVIATASNTVTATIPVPGFNAGVVLTPDGARVYVSGFSGASIVSVIDTTTNTVESSTIPTGPAPAGMAVTPDGSLVYVTSVGGNTVSVIDTATNTVVGSPIAVGTNPFGIAIANLSTPFASFPAPTVNSVNNPNRISLSGTLALGANSSGLDFAHQSMTLTVGGFSLLFPAGTVTQVGNSSQQHFTFSGTLNGLSVTFDLIGNSPNFTYSFTIQGKNVGTQVGPNPVTVTLKLGRNSGTTTVNF